MNLKLANNNGMEPYLENFIKTLPQEQKASNVYEIIVEDRNGKRLDTKFGVNTMTTAGFYREAGSHYAPPYIILGKGTGTTTVNDTLMFEDIPGIRSIDETHYDLNNTSGMMNTYDPVSNCMIGRRKTGQFVMDYETNNDTAIENDGNPHITEFAEFQLDSWNAGMDRPYNPASYANNNTMHTHCLIYDANHNPSYFDKVRGTKVTVNIYRAIKVNCALFDTLRNQGVYMFLSPAYMVKDPSTSGSSWQMMGSTGSVHCGRNREEKDYPMYALTTSRINFGDGGDFNNLLRWYNWGYGHSQDGYGHITMSTGGVNYARTAVSPSGYRNNVTFGEYIQTDTEYVKAGIVFLHYNRSYQVDGYWGYRNYQTGQKAYANPFMAFIKINLDEPEEMELEWAYTDDFMHPRFRNIFGLSHYFYDWPHMLAQQLPCNDFHLTSVKRYNYLTDEYDIDETFVDDPDYDFRNPERAAWGHMFLTGFKNGATFDVYMNIHDDIAIEGFMDIGRYEIYMTDTYWDYTSFVKLDDNAVVPAALQHKKYIIKYPSSNPSNSSDGMGKTGIHPQRETNKHKIVPAESNIEINVDITLPTYNYWSARKMYSSDDGWVFCHGKLIYLESDDGTGHPYMYTIPIFTGGYSESMIRFTHNRIFIIDDDTVFQPGNTTRVRFYIYDIDPTHPDVDPTANPVCYYDPDIKFKVTSNINDDMKDFATFVVDEPKNRLYIERNGEIMLIDLDNFTHNLEMITDNDDPDKMHVSTTQGFTRWGIIYGTDLLVSYVDGGGASGMYTFEIYDLANRTSYGTFTISYTYQTSVALHQMFGYKGMIYIQIVIDSVYHIFMYNYEDDELLDVSSVSWNYLYGEGTPRRANMKWNMMKYDDDAIVISCWASTNNNDNVGARTMIITSDKLTTPYYFDSTAAEGSYTGNRANSFVSTGQHGLPDIKKFNGGKDYMVLIHGNILPYNNGSNNQGGNFGGSYILNFGYIKNHNMTDPTKLNASYCAPFFKIPNAYRDESGVYPNQSSSSNYEYRYTSGQTWYAETCFYKNKVLVIPTFGKPLLMPLDTFLHYKITGTTKTLQAHNHPRKYNQHSYGAIVDLVENMT